MKPSDPTPLFLITGRERYGPRRAALGLADHLRTAGWDFVFASLEDEAFTAEVEQAGHRVVRLGVGRAPGLEAGGVGRVKAYLQLRAYERRAAERVAAAVRESGAGVIHVRWPNLVGLAGRAGSLAGVPTLWHMPNIVGGGYPFDLNKRMYRRMCRKRSILPVGNSRYTASTVGGDIPRTWIYLGIDKEQFDPDRSTSLTRAEAGLPEVAPVAGIIGRIEPSKGQDRIVRAMGLLGEAAADLHLYLVGGPTEGAYADSIRELASSLGLAGRVHFAGEVPDPVANYRLIDISINARVDPEPFGLSVIESMMMRRPILVHALGGPAETVLDGETGWHVHDPSPESFAAGLRRALDARADWPRLGERAREHAIERFSKEVYADRYMEVLRKLAAEGVRGFADGA